MWTFLSWLFKKSRGAPAAAAPAAPLATPSRDETVPAFGALLDLLLRPLPADDRTRLRAACRAHHAAGLPPEVALMSGLSEAQRHGGWVLMQVDWKSADEVEWQAREIAALHGIAVSYSCAVAGSPPSTVLVALRHFDDWLQPHGRRFVFLDLDADAYHGVVVACAEEAPVVALAKAAGVTLMSTPAFLRSQGESE